ncbi:MAG: hypothetical protein AAFX93_10145 [Verrucomicrobiota bacterium]
MKTFTVICLSLLVASSASFAGPGKERQGGQERQERLLEEFDLDGNGELDESERQAAQEARFERMAINRFDSDGDGVLSDTERAEAEAFQAERKEKMLERFDADGNGELDQEERRKARRVMQRHMNKNGAGKGGGEGRQGPPRSSEYSSNSDDIAPPAPGN